MYVSLLLDDVAVRTQHFPQPFNDDWLLLLCTRRKGQGTALFEGAANQFRVGCALIREINVYEPTSNAFESVQRLFLIALNLRTLSKKASSRQISRSPTRMIW
jgi:hypothetical protein